MRMIKFKRPMAPHGIGDTRVVPDVVAKRLVEDEKVADYEASVFDKPTGEAGAATPPIPKRKRPLLKGAGQ